MAAFVSITAYAATETASACYVEHGIRERLSRIRGGRLSTLRTPSSSARESQQLWRYAALTRLLERFASLIRTIRVFVPFQLRRALVDFGSDPARRE